MGKNVILNFGRVDRILIRMVHCQTLLYGLCKGADGLVYEDAVAAAADLLGCICTDFEAIINEADAERLEGGHDQ